MRAQRFRLEMPMRYRPIGATDWVDGRMVNISRTGVLFAAGSEMSPDERIEVCFALPGPSRPAHIVCRGRVVRVVPPGDEAARPAIAATISRYRFTNRPLPEA